jgi:hypothetical protein
LKQALESMEKKANHFKYNLCREKQETIAMATKTEGAASRTK